MTFRAGRLARGFYRRGDACVADRVRRPTEIDGRAEFGEQFAGAFGAVRGQMTRPVRRPRRRGGGAPPRGSIATRWTAWSTVACCRHHSCAAAPSVAQQSVVRQSSQCKREECSSSRGSIETTIGGSTGPAARLPCLRIERRPSRGVLGLEHDDRPCPAAMPADGQRRIVGRRPGRSRRDVCVCREPIREKPSISSSACPRVAGSAEGPPHRRAPRRNQRPHDWGLTAGVDPGP